MTVKTKKIIGLFILSLSINVYSQISINKDTSTSKNIGMEFNDQKNIGGEAKGIILPYVNHLETTSSSGTLYYDANTKQVKYVKSPNEIIDMTPEGDEDVTLPDYSTMEDNGKGIEIGYDKGQSADKHTKGVLSFSNKRILVLPYVENAEMMPKDVEPGTIVYDNKTKSIAIFNGTVWSFWGCKE